MNLQYVPYRLEICERWCFPIAKWKSSNTVNVDSLVACVFLIPGVLIRPFQQCSWFFHGLSLQSFYTKSPDMGGFPCCHHTELCVNPVTGKWVWNLQVKAKRHWHLIRAKEDIEQNFKWGFSLGTESLQSSSQEKTNTGCGGTIATVESLTVMIR